MLIPSYWLYLPVMLDPAIPSGDVEGYNRQGLRVMTGELGKCYMSVKHERITLLKAGRAAYDVLEEKQKERKK